MNGRKSKQLRMLAAANALLDEADALRDKWYDLPPGGGLWRGLNNILAKRKGGE